MKVATLEKNYFWGKEVNGEDLFSVEEITGKKKRVVIGVIKNYIEMKKKRDMSGLRFLLITNNVTH